MKQFLLILMTCAMAMGLYAQHPCPGMPTVTDHEGNVYNTVRIGNQCWMKENLRTTTSPSTGTYLIPPVGTSYTTTGKQARWYNNDSATYAPQNYGLLYNWNAAVDTFNTAYGETSVSTSGAVSMPFHSQRRGICPEGWHLPTDGDWHNLERYVGSVTLYIYTAKALASETGWESCYSGFGFPGSDQNETVNNTTGFSAIPAGYFNGSFLEKGYTTHFWTFGQDNSLSNYYALYRDLDYNKGRLGNESEYKACGQSVRCLRDVPAISSGEPCPNAPTINDIEGNSYNTVKLGNRCWMKENLRTTKIRNGNNILNGGSYTDNNTSYYYNYSTSNIPLTERGYLYNWPAAREACPPGWHLPTDAEWTVMETTLTSLDLTGTDFRGDHAGFLAGGTSWDSSYVESAPGNMNNNIHNLSGFTAIPAGAHTNNGFLGSGSSALFWTSDVENDAPWIRQLYFNNAGVNRSTVAKSLGYSVRCVRDIVSTTAINSTSTSITIVSEVIDDDDVTARGVCWSTNSSSVNIAGEHTNDGTGTGTFTSQITGLSPSTTYYLRAYATSSAGTFYGVTIAYQTQCSTVNVSITGNTTINAGESTTLTASVTGSDMYTFDWSTGPGATAHTITVSPSVTTTYTVTVTDIPSNCMSTDNVTVIVRTKPTVTTNSVSDIGTTLATCGGNVTDDGNATVTARGVCWSTGHNPTVSDAHTSNGSGTGSFTSQLTNLEPGTTYYVRAYATNSLGTTYGNERSFSTVFLCDPEDQCALTFVLTDSYGDSWNGNAIRVTDAAMGIVLGVLSNVDLNDSSCSGGSCEETQMLTLAVCNGRTVNFEWIAGSWPEETSYTVYDGHGEVIFSGTGGFSETYTFTMNCCQPPTNLNVSDISNQSATMWWEGTGNRYLVRYRTPASVETFFEEGFENGIPATWTTIDQDGDGHNWFLNNYTEQSHNGSGNAASESFDLSAHAALTPNNWLITPQIDLQGTMKLWLRGSDPETDFLEHFAIYLSTTGNAVSDFTTTLVGESVTTNTYTEYSADLSEYAGQQGYIAIRHFNCTDMNRLLVDDFGLYGDTISAGGWNTVGSTGTSTTITDLTSGTRYEVQAQSLCNGSPSAWSESIEFTTDLCDPEDQCELTFVLTDSYGDGWNGNAIKVVDAETGFELGILANENLTYQQSEETVTLSLCDGRTVNFEWVEGGWPQETSYAVYDGNGEEIFSGSGGFTTPISYTVSCASPCPAISLPYTENFDAFTESTTTATGVEPTCWELVRTDAPSMPDDKRPQLCYNSSFAHSGSYSLKMSNRCVYAMPELAEDVQVNKLRLDMFLRQANARYRLEVGIWDGQTFVPVATFDNGSTDVLAVSCDFSSYTGNGRRVAFRNSLNDGSNLAYSTNYLDDITLSLQLCEAITPPYTENFDSFTQSTATATGVEPNCWELVRTDASSMPDDKRPQLCYNSSFAHSGSYSLKMSNRCVYAMPELAEDVQVNKLRLDMFLRQANARYRLEVGIWDGQTFVPVATFDNGSTNVLAVSCDFSSYTGNGRRVAFRNSLNDGSNLAYSTNYLDDITLSLQLCEEITPPYTENFDNFTQSTAAATGVEPDCWELVRTDASSMPDDKRPQLCYNSSFAHSGNYSLKMSNRCVYAMPELSEDVQVNKLRLDMFLRQANARYRLEVGIWDGQTFVPVATFDNGSTDVLPVSCNFSSYTGNGRRIAFRNSLNDGSNLAYSTNYLDDITLSEQLCEKITPPYTENFDSFTQSTTAATGVEPDCWELVRTDAPSMPDDRRPQLYYKSDFAHSGSYSLKLNNRGVYAMPELAEDVTVSSLKLEMYLRQANAAYQLEVGVWDEATNSFEMVKRFNNTSTDVEFVTCDFSNYTGNGRRIAFRNVLGSGSYAYSVNYIDDISLSEIVDCSISTLPYIETFEDFTESTTAATGVEPDCWELVRTDAPSMPDDKRPQIYYNSSFASSGNYTLKMGNRCVYAMPELGPNVPIRRVALDMYLRQPNAAYRLEVGVWDDATNTFERVKLINNSTTAVEHVSCDFSGYNGNGRRVAFRNTLNNGKTWDYSYNYLDDITLTRIDNNKSAEVTSADAMNTDRDLDVKIYPNPTKDYINVECTMNNVQCSGIEVIDVYGKVVCTVVGANNYSPVPTQINVSGLAAGMYFVRVTTDKGAVTKPFVKK